MTNVPRADTRSAPTEPWVAVVIVAVLALILLVVLRNIGVTSRRRLDVQRNLAMLADSQAEHKRRFGTFAAAMGGSWDSATVRLRPDSGTVITIERADSAGWIASATHPGLRGRNSTCHIFGGVIAHDAKLLRAGDPRCW